MTTDIERILATPIAEIPRDPNEAEIVRRFWRTASNQGSRKPDRIAIATGLAPDGNNFSQVLVEIPAGTPEKAYLRNGWSRGTNGGFVGRKVPLPCPTRDDEGNLVVPPNGRDSQGSIRRPDGTWFNYWRWQVPWNTNRRALADNPNLPQPNLMDRVLRRNFNPAADFTTETVEIIPPDEKGNRSTRSPAVPMHHVLTLDDLLDGVTHCIVIAVSSLCSMNGPPSAKGEPPIISHEDNRLLLPAKAGGRGASRMPALFLETKTAVAPLEHQVSDGTRLFLKATDEQIRGWIDATTSDPVVARMKRNLAIGLRDFGFMIGATSGPTGGIVIYADGSAKATKALRQLELTQAVMDNLLTGLLTPGSIGVVIPPTGVLADGTRTTMHGPAVSIAY